MLKNTILCAGLVLAGGCGGGGSSVAAIDSELLGIYLINRYAVNPEGCDNPQMAERLPGTHLVLYSFVPAEAEESALGGAFCNGVEACREVARDAATPGLGYVFLEGSDSAGWKGWGTVPNTARFIGGMCEVELQEHTLTFSGTNISAVTENKRAFYEGNPTSLAGTEVECGIRAAIEAIEGQPCLEIIELDGAFEAGL